MPYKTGNFTSSAKAFQEFVNSLSELEKQEKWEKKLKEAEEPPLEEIENELTKMEKAGGLAFETPEEKLKTAKEIRLKMIADPQWAEKRKEEALMGKMLEESPAALTDLFREKIIEQRQLRVGAQKIAGAKETEAQKAASKEQLENIKQRYKQQVFQENKKQKEIDRQLREARFEKGLTESKKKAMTSAQNTYVSSPIYKGAYDSNRLFGQLLNNTKRPDFDPTDPSFQLDMVKSVEKLKDPNSAVLQGEADSWREASSLMNTLVSDGAWDAASKKLLKKLTPDQVNTMLRLAENMQQTNKDAFNNYRNGRIVSLTDIGYTPEEAKSIFSSINWYDEQPSEIMKRTDIETPQETAKKVTQKVKETVAPRPEKKQLSELDRQALEWAKQNPDDPRAQEIINSLGE